MEYTVLVCSSASSWNGLQGIFWRVTRSVREFRETDVHPLAAGIRLLVNLLPVYIALSCQLLVAVVVVERGGGVRVSRVVPVSTLYSRTSRLPCTTSWRSGNATDYGAEKKVLCCVMVLVPVDLSIWVCYPWAPADFRSHGYRRGYRLLGEQRHTSYCCVREFAFSFIVIFVRDVWADQTKS